MLLEILLGTIGPLAVAAASWALMVRTSRRQPERLTAVLIAAFGVKLVVFGAYVAIVVGVLSLQPVPFAVSFAIAFIALHLMEAVGLRRLSR